METDLHFSTEFLRACERSDPSVVEWCKKWVEDPPLRNTKGVPPGVSSQTLTPTLEGIYPSAGLGVHLEGGTLRGIPLCTLGTLSSVLV